MEAKRNDQPLVIALVLSLCGLIAVIAFAAGLMTQRNLLDDESTESPAELSSLSADTTPGDVTTDFSRLNEVQELITNEYYGLPADTDQSDQFWNDLEGHALKGLAEGLDGYSSYLPPAQQQQVENELEGTFEGIGVWVASRNGQMTIVAPIPGSPAEESGIKAGDVIVEIDGQMVEGLTDTEAMDLLRGPAGEKVHLVIARPDLADPLIFDVERKKMPMPVVSYRYLTDQDVSVISITVFGDKTASELDTALELAKEDGAAGIVLDLRNNGGGWVQSAQQTIGRFLPDDVGPALYEDFDPAIEGDEQAEAILNNRKTPTDTPLVVVVNGGTASAAEIVAGALNDYDRAEIVGEKTFGKGSVQRVHEFDDGSSFRLTFAHWLTPDKHVIDGEGIEPDVVVTPAARGVESDAQLDAAVKLLHGEDVK